jgi:hypothetical protein
MKWVMHVKHGGGSSRHRNTQTGTDSPCRPLILQGTPAAKITEPFMAFGGRPVPAGTVVKAPTPANPQQGIIAGGGMVYSFDPQAADIASTMRLEARRLS